METVYLDHAATTPVAPEVLEAMLPFLSHGFGNPSSVHAAGRAARNAVDGARDALAAVIGASQRELVFTATASPPTSFTCSVIQWKSFTMLEALTTSMK